MEAPVGAGGSKACSPEDSGCPASGRGASASPRGSSPDSGKSLCSVEDLSPVLQGPSCLSLPGGWDAGLCHQMWHGCYFET